MIQFGMCYGAIIHAVRSVRKAKQTKGAFFRIMKSENNLSLRQEIFAHFRAGRNAAGTVENQSLPLFLLFSIFLHSSEIV